MISRSNAVQRSTTQPSFGHLDFPNLGAPTTILSPVPSPVAIPVPSTVSSPVLSQAPRPVPSTIPSSVPSTVSRPVPSTVQVENEPVANPNSSTGAIPEKGNLLRDINNFLKVS